MGSFRGRTCRGEPQYALVAMLPSGDQFILSDGRQEAVVCEVGATLRRYAVDGRPVCWGFEEHERCHGGRGQVLAPWPNRLEDGRYEHDGIPGAAALDEPELHNAIHGLVRWIPWTLTQDGPGCVRASCIIHEQPGYPFTVSLSCEYRLRTSGLEVRTTAESLGTRSAPFGLGFHPYLDAGGPVDGACVQVPARRWLVADDRLLPRSEAPVTEGAFEGLCGDGPAPIGARILDDCCTDLQVGADGRWRARFVPAGGPEDAVTLWAEACFGWIMVFTGDTLEPGDRRRALAVEPMTCPPNALRSGEGVVVLEPGTPFEATWGLTPDRLA